MSPEYILFENGYKNGVAGALARNVFVNCDTAQKEVILAGAGERIVGVTLEAATTEGQYIRIAEAPSVVRVIAGEALTREDASGNPTRVKVGSSGYAVGLLGTGSETAVGEVHPASDEPGASGDLVLIRLYVGASEANGIELPTAAAGDDEKVLSYEHSTTDYVLVEALTVTNPASQAQGDVFYNNGTNLARLAAGTDEQVLVTQGAGANPKWLQGLTTDYPASQAQGDVFYKGATNLERLGAGTKGQMLMTGGSAANPSFAYPRSYLHVGPLSDQGVGATVVVKLGNVPAGRVWVPLHLTVQSGTTSGATAQLKAAGSGAMDALAVDGDTDTATFTDNSFAAGQAITVDLVTIAGTGDLDAANVIFCFADLPA